MLEWQFWMQRVLSNEPVIRYEDSFTYSTLTQPKTCRGANSIGLMMMLSLLLALNIGFVFHPILYNVFLIEPWQHAGLVFEGSWVWFLLPPLTFFSFISLKFFFHKKSWVQIPFFNFQGGPLLCSQKFSQWIFYQ